MKSGHGKMKYANGEIYDGEWAHDYREGKGEYHYKDGDLYIGAFLQLR